MADTRTSKTWKPSGKAVKIDDEITASNFADWLMIMTEKEINYDFMMQIFGEYDDKPAFARPYDLLIVPEKAYSYTDAKGKEVYNKNEFTTTVGTWIINVIMKRFKFNKFFGGYYDKTINKKEYGKIEKRLSYALVEDQITTDDLKDWENMVQWLMPFEDVLSPNHTEKLITCSKVINKKKAQLLKQYKDELATGDPSVIEKISNELLDYAREYLGDDPAIDTIMSGAGGSFGNNFKNTYVIRGAILNPDPYAKKKYNIVTSNLIDGISAEEYSTMAGAGVQGAYARGRKTRTGGYWEKLMVLAYQHIHLDPKGSDCHSTHYVTVKLTDDNIDYWMYNYMVSGDGNYKLLDYESRDKYIGKTVKFRFASMCKSKTGICNICAGELLYIISENIGMSMAQVASTLKNIAMSAFHDSVVTTTTFDPMEAFYQDDESN